MAQLNNSALVLVMAWQQTIAKLLPETMVTQFNDAYMRHQTSVS